MFAATGAFKEFPATLPQLYNQILFWVIMMFSVLFVFALEMILLPKIKIKMKESMRKRFNKFIIENKSAIYISFLFLILSLFISKIG